MDFTVTLSQSFNLSPFKILKQDKDHVIMLINYFIEKGNDEPTKSVSANPRKLGKNDRIRVNDKTATNGWF